MALIEVKWGGYRLLISPTDIGRGNASSGSGITATLAILFLIAVLLY